VYGLDTLESRTLFSTNNPFLTSLKVDPSFGGGLVATDFGLQNSEADSAAVLKDGRVAAAGAGFNGDSGPEVVLLAVYNHDGSPSKSFSGDGKLILPNAIFQKLNPSSTKNELVIRQTPDGGLLLTGTGGLYKVKLDGSVDTAFGQAGFAPRVLPVIEGDAGFDDLLSNGTFREVVYDGKNLTLHEISPTGHDTTTKHIPLAVGNAAVAFGKDGVTVATSTGGVYRYHFDLSKIATFGSDGRLSIDAAFQAWAAAHAPWRSGEGDGSAALHGLPTFTILSVFQTPNGIGVAGTSDGVSDKTIISIGAHWDSTDFSATISSTGSKLDFATGPYSDIGPGGDQFVGRLGSDYGSFAGTVVTADGIQVGITFPSPFISYASSGVEAPDRSFYVVGYGSDGDDAAANRFAIGRTASLIDSNHNGKLDSGERSVTADSVGKYTLDNLAPGKYDIKRVLPNSAYRITTPLSLVTVVAQDELTVDIGSTSRH